MVVVEVAIGALLWFIFIIYYMRFNLCDCVMRKRHARVKNVYQLSGAMRHAPHAMKSLGVGGLI